MDFSAVLVKGQEMTLFRNHELIFAFYLHCFWVFFWFKYGIKCFSVFWLWCTHWWQYRQIIWHNPPLNCESLAEFFKFFTQLIQQNVLMLLQDLLWWSAQTVESCTFSSVESCAFTLLSEWGWKSDHIDCIALCVPRYTKLHYHVFLMAS